MKLVFRLLIQAGLLLAITALAIPAFALNIDDFDGDQHVIATGPGAIEASTLQNNTTIGEYRAIKTQVISGSYIFALTALGIFSHSQGADVRGLTLVTWDGDDLPLNLNPSGLDGIDFTQDGGDAIEMKVLSFDFPLNQPVDIVLTIYDASDATGQKSSSATITLARAYSDETVSVPFAGFTQHGPAGAASFENVGALTMLINGENPAVDLELDYIRTNGECQLFPVDGRVIDECGVCGGDNSSCADCVGVPNGPALPGSECETGDVGQCQDGTYDESCECQQDQPAQAESCDGVDNDCDGEIDEIVDSCGVCGGDDSTCLDCGGTPNGSALPGTSCQTGLEGICQSGAYDESCQCNPIQTASTEICDGIDNDCDGETDEIVDQCGVCGGDGTSCLTCVQKEQSGISESLDGGVKNLERQIGRALRRLTGANKQDRKLHKYADRTKKLAHEIQLRSWTISWWLEPLVTECDAPPQCVRVTNTSILDEYIENNNKMFKILKRAMKKVKNSTRGSWRKSDLQLLRAGEKQFKKNQDLANSVPREQYVC
ncbi:MAG: putative metal-binding motif-containing protein [Bdellovibrionales bacterium]|nr:putative metal-binding motif-containing protein [Bdellovibrionales bacterium]